MKQKIIITALVFLSVLFVRADTFILKKSDVTSFEMTDDNVPARVEMAKLWIGKNRYASHTRLYSTILDFNKDVMILVNHKEKTYIELKLPLDFTPYYPDEGIAQGIQNMMKTLSVTVKPNGLTLRAGKWLCQGYRMEIVLPGMATKTTTVWASTDVKFDWRKAHRVKKYLVAASLKIDMERLKQMDKIKGAFILTESIFNVLGDTFRTREQVIEISRKSPEEGVYDVPPGYEKKEKFTLDEISGIK